MFSHSKIKFLFFYFSGLFCHFLIDWTKYSWNYSPFDIICDKVVDEKAIRIKIPNDSLFHFEHLQREHCLDKSNNSSVDDRFIPFCHTWTHTLALLSVTNPNAIERDDRICTMHCVVSFFCWTTIDHSVSLVQLYSIGGRAISMHWSVRTERCMTSCIAAAL